MAKKQAWKTGDVFGVPLGNGHFGLGQVISQEKHCMDSVLCAYFSLTIEGVGGCIWVPDTAELISVQITTRDLLDAGVWPVIYNAPCMDVQGLFPIDELRNAGYVGAVIQGSAIMAELLSAYHGLTPWDDFYEPDFLDKLLISGVKRPDNVFLKKRK